MANWQSSNTPKPYPSVAASPAPSERQQQQQAPPPYTNPPVYPDSQPIAEYAIIIPRPGAGQRFLSAFCVATFIWVLLSLLVQSTVNAVQFGNKHRGRSVGDNSIYSDLHLGNCVQATGWNQEQRSSSFSLLRFNYGTNFQPSGSTSFTLPISSSAFFFISRGENLGGSLSVVTSPNQAAQSVTVNVQVTSNRGDALEQTKACLLTGDNNEHGVGVFTPTNEYPAFWDSNFHITVILPESANGGPLDIKDFETDLPNSSQQFGDLDQKVTFDAIFLSGSNGPISVQSLTTNTGKINTSNGKITGTFNATQSLALVTTNAGINVNVGLTSEQEDSNPTLTAITENGAIDADISLLSTSGSGGSFQVIAKTSNQAVQLVFPTSPSGSTLNLQASTENALASVFLDTAYSGSFDVQTSAYEDAQVNVVRPNVSGRHVNYSGQGKGETTGNVAWDNGASSSNGRVSVSTTNGRAVLEL